MAVDLILEVVERGGTLGEVRAVVETLGLRLVNCAGGGS